MDQMKDYSLFQSIAEVNTTYKDKHSQMWTARALVLGRRADADNKESMGRIMPLRVSPEEEEEGLDESQHGEKAFEPWLLLFLGF